jgi:rare lipoprotein A
MHKLIYFILILVFILIDTEVNAQQAKKPKRKLTAKDSSIIKSPAPSSPKEIVIKYGVASFYAHKFNGRKTANGNIYNSLKYTAACNLLPLGTWVKVTNVKNDKSVIVYINDRLHPKNKRLVDLSKSAAEKLGFISNGITKVKVEVLGKLQHKSVL